MDDLVDGYPQVVEVASTSSYQLQLQQLQNDEAAAAAKAAADAMEADLQASLDALFKVMRRAIHRPLGPAVQRMGCCECMCSVDPAPKHCQCGAGCEHMAAEARG